MLASIFMFEFLCVCASIVYKYFYIQILKSRSTVIEGVGGVWKAMIWIRSSYGIFCLKTIVIYAAVKTADIVTWVFFTRSLKKVSPRKDTTEL